VDRYELRRLDYSLSEAHTDLQAAYRQFFKTSCSIDTVRAAEASGFDKNLWERLCAMGATTMALPESCGGDGATLVDLTLVAEEIGRSLAPVPWIDHVCAARLLARLGALDIANDGAADLVNGAQIAGLDPQIDSAGRVRLIPAGSVADHVIVRDGETIEGEGWGLQAVATPGHTANHLAFAWRDRKILFVGDHVMGWSTSIVAPPDGSMIDYMASLQKLTQREENLYFSGHGPEIPDGPQYVRFLIRHRQAREASILHRLAKGEADIPTMVRAIYIGIDPRLTGAAGYSVLAHLEDLVARGIVATEGDPVIGGTYRLAAAS